MIDTDYWLSQIENNTSELSKILLIMIIFIIAVFCLIFSGNKQVVIDNWSQYRCNPIIMPFSDFFGKPSNKNFQSCLWIMVEKYAKFLLKPFHYINSLTYKILHGFGGSINDIRKMMLQIRYFFLSIVSNVMNRLFSLMGNMQYFMVKLRYTLQKNARGNDSLYYILHLRGCRLCLALGMDQLVDLLDFFAFIQTL